MRLALVNGERREPGKGQQGQCIGCGQKMVSKCGPIKMWHWAHKSNCECDHWWETETPWHRAWKGNFPFEWQEIRQKSENGEWHIADVKTNNGQIIEFQHSYLTQEERQSRNIFYGSNLVWVVDGLARKNDRAHFELLLKDAKQILPNFQLSQLRSASTTSALLRDWSQCKGLVFFDFGVDLPLWCLLPKSVHGNQYVLPYLRQNFVSLHKELLNDRGYLELSDYLNALVFSYENPRPTHERPFPLKRPAPQRQTIVFPRANPHALINYLIRPQQRVRRKFRF